VKNKNKIYPQYIKNSKGKPTHVYLSIEVYNAMSENIKKYEKIKKKEKIRWVKISTD
jgi:hypothetical protein